MKRKIWFFYIMQKDNLNNYLYKKLAFENFIINMYKFLRHENQQQINA